MRTCIVCGKSIRTGWKYCHEHRNTSQYNRIKNENKVEEKGTTPQEDFIDILFDLFAFIRKHWLVFVLILAFFIAFGLRNYYSRDLGLDYSRAAGQMCPTILYSDTGVHAAREGTLFKEEQSLFTWLGNRYPGPQAKLMEDKIINQTYPIYVMKGEDGNTYFCHILQINGQSKGWRIIR